MKILLVGEFSGVHTNLKKALIAKGHTVAIVGKHDGFKKFDSDLNVSPYIGNTIGKFKNIFYFLLNIKNYIGYDVVQFINPFEIPYYYHFVGLNHLLFKFNKKIIYYAAGTDPAFLSSDSKLNYFPFSNKNSTEHPNYPWYKIVYYNWFIKKIHLIIPAMYSYSIGYYHLKKCRKHIKLIGTGVYTNANNTVNNHISILHGITRPEFKGSEIITKALRIIKEKYKSKVKIYIVKRLPYSEYETYLNNVDIMIDQCKSYDYGMNAILALEKGVVVLSGAEDVAMAYLNVESSAVINIKPSIDEIVAKLEKIIQNKNQLSLLKKHSINYVKKYHNPKLIAKEFLDYYTE